MSELVTVDALKARGAERRFATHECPALGGVVRIRSLRGDEYAQIKSLMQRAVMANQADKEEKGSRLLVQSQAALIQLCVVDENGEPMFSADDRKAIREWDSGLLEWLESLCIDHCGLDADDVEGAAKN